jgi:hypothetical protein
MAFSWENWHAAAMLHVPYRGSGPYCYANSLAMMMGVDAPEPAVIETVTGSPFGMQLVGGALPFFDPYGWTPETGVQDALAAAGPRALSAAASPGLRSADSRRYWRPGRSWWARSRWDICVISRA